MPILAYMGVDYALSFKGCYAPTLSFKVGRSYVICDLVLKLSLLIVFSDLEDYVGVCMLCSLALWFYNVVAIYWELRKQSVRTIKKFPGNENYTILGIKSLLLFGGCILSESFIFYENWEWVDPTEMLIYISIADSMGILMIVFVLMQLLRLDRIKIPAMRSLHSLQSNQSPILLLRSFELDKYPWWNNKTFDEELCDNIDINECPIISLSDPDQILPTGGSLKIQSKDDYWKSVIEELLQSCRAIVVVEGDSEGLNWEIERIREVYKKQPEKVFFYIPANKYRTLAWCINEQGGFGITRNLASLMLKIVSPIKIRKQLKQVWNNFYLFISSKGFKMQSSYSGPNSLITFDSNGQSTVIKESSKNLFNFVLNITAKFNNNSVDYTEMARKIEQYEVNGFLKDAQLKEYKSIASKLTKTNYIIACIFLLLGIVLLLK